MNFLRSKKDRNLDAASQVGLIPMSGTLSLVHSSFPTIEGDVELADLVQNCRPRNDLAPELNLWKLDNVINIKRGLDKVIKARQYGIPHFYGMLWLNKNDGELDYGLVSFRVVTTVGVGYIVDAFANSVELENMKYHALGTGNTAEAAGDTDMVTELTTQYSSNSTRATGTTTEGASANIYRTVGTNTVDATVAIVEHGIFSNATTGQGVLLDRSVFSTVNLVSGDSLSSTYDLTFTAGS